MLIKKAFGHEFGKWSMVNVRLSFAFLCVHCSFCSGQVLCAVNIHETGTTRHWQLTQLSGLYSFLTPGAFRSTTGTYSHCFPAAATATTPRKATKHQAQVSQPTPGEHFGDSDANKAIGVGSMLG